VPDRATAGLPTIAVRSPAHVVARELIEEVGEPISAPSANRSGHVSPTTAQHVFEEFSAADDAAARDLLIIDGGACDVGIESTVLDLTRSPPRLLRPGSVTLEQLRDVLGEVEAPTIESQDSSPGTSRAHYAPRTPAELADASAMRGLLAAHAAAGRRCAALCLDAGVVAPPHAAIAVSADPHEYAHDLYRLLREADALGYDAIIIETPASATGLWHAVWDRLHRAAAGT
jgi:L-threonylcarbamoyladenylate synthase